ncbi:MarR family transcriptional regulator [candidate division WOR-3 bacterium]|nr:MarR family transcriptional regulator [candidate division WOR-3 bacterium]
MEKKFLDELHKYLPTIQKELVKGGSSALTKGEITLPQMFLLQIVFEKNMCTMTDLSKNIGITKSAVTGLTDRLIRSKLIARTRGIKDRRIVIISLTEKGKNLIKKVLNEHQQMIKKAFSPLTHKEQEIYLDLIKKIYKGLVKK